MKTKSIFALSFLLLSCGDGDGPVGSTHPTLATCDRSRQGSPTTCEEYRNITDGDWPQVSAGCETSGNNNKNILTEYGACSPKNTKGACRDVATFGTTVTTWYYKCSADDEAFCEKQPSEIQTECQSAGGTYIPPDEAG